MTAQVIPFPPRVHASLDFKRLRVVKYLGARVVLTDGRNLALFVPAELGCTSVVRVRGVDYRYARRARAVEL